MPSPRPTRHGPAAGVVALLLCLLALAGCTTAGDPAGLPDAAPALLAPADGLPSDVPELAAPLVEPVDCDPLLQDLAAPQGTIPDVAGLADATCGYVVVPEDRDQPTGQVVEVAWVRLPGIPSEDPPVQPAPVLVVVPDGPGGAATDEVVAWADAELRTDRDLLLVDPRGTGRSFPSLDCGQPARIGALPPDFVEDCRRQLAAAGVAPETTTTRAMAADLVDLVTALDLGPVDLLGIGHGGRTALTVLRDAPQVVRAAVLDSPIPLDVDPVGAAPRIAADAVDRLLAWCAAAGRCAADLGARLEEALAELDDVAADDVEASDVAITGDQVALAALAAMRGVDGPAAVPDALAAVVAGDAGRAVALLEDAAGPTAPWPTPASEGVRLSVLCAEEVPATQAPDDDGPSEGGDDDGAFARAVAAELAGVVAACATWPAAGPTPAMAQPVTATARVLVLSGRLDPRSPPAWGDRIAASIDGATAVTVDGAGHRVHDASACATALVTAFLARPGAAVDDRCAAEGAG